MDGRRLRSTLMKRKPPPRRGKHAKNAARHARSHSAMARAVELHEAGRIDDAVAQYRKALESDPENAGALNNLGMAYQTRGDLDEAAACLRQALAVEPGHAGLHNTLGTILCASRDFDLALEAFDRAIALDPGHLDAHRNLAAFHEEHNRTAKASAAAERGLARFPGDPALAVCAARCERRAGRADSALERLAAIPVTGLEPSLAGAIHYELGRLHDRTGAFEAAFAHFETANGIQAAEWSATAERGNRTLAMVEHLRETVTRAWVESWPPFVPTEAPLAPVFLVGFLRTGTTLLDRILDSHPSIHTIEEQPMVQNLINAVAGLPGGYPDAIARLTVSQCEQLRAAYLESARERVPEAAPGAILVDKLPLNSIHIALIHRLFPDARIILTIRHPADVCLSCFMTEIQSSDAMSNFFTLEGTVRFYTRTMDLWCAYESLLPLTVHRVKYEALVEDPEGETRRLTDFLGLPWHENLLSHEAHARRGPISSPSYADASEPIYQHARYRWTNYADPLRDALPALSPYEERFGYALD
jgi:tetratricopeptide (TPR) repeat protein